MEDKQIVSKFQKGKDKERYFKMIFDKHQQKIYWHVRTMVVNHDDADDVTQSTFIKVWKNLDKFEGKSSLSTWLYRIATNEALTHLGKNKKQVKTKDADTIYYLADQVEQQDGYDPKSIEWQLQKAIQTLPEKQKTVFLLRYYSEMPFKEIAIVMNVAESTLKSNYHHAVVKIKKYLLTNAS